MVHCAVTCNTRSNRFFFFFFFFFMCTFHTETAHIGTLSHTFLSSFSYLFPFQFKFPFYNFPSFSLHFPFFLASLFPGGQQKIPREERQRGTLPSPPLPHTAVTPLISINPKRAGLFGPISQQAGGGGRIPPPSPPRSRKTD